VNTRKVSAEPARNHPKTKPTGGARKYQQKVSDPFIKSASVLRFLFPFPPAEAERNPSRASTQHNRHAEKNLE
jgi:hypothetical protein